MPCDGCERGCMDPCGFEPSYSPTYSEEFCGAEIDAFCDGYIPGDPGDYMIDKCKIRLGIYWLFNEPAQERNEEPGS